jgi:hypothetical protein
VRQPRDIGAVAAQARGEFELFLKQNVDDVIMRLACAPEIVRKNGVHTHRVIDDQSLVREVIVLRQWEAERLTGKLPLSMRKGRIVFFTGSWESISLCWAAKDLHDASRFPYIHDPTLPQHRLNEALPSPRQKDYPVWYFLTGPITKPNKLQTLIKRNSEPYKQCAVVHGLVTLRHREFEATVETDFHKKYAMLGPSVGTAYLIKSKEEEDRLRYFKTDDFAVVRCKITLCPIHESGQPHEVDGLTFVLGQHSALYDCMQEVPAHEMTAPISTEPSLPFVGFDHVMLEGAEEGHEPIDMDINAFVFPFLEKGRECKAQDVYQRRDLLRSPVRARSPLMAVESNEFKTPSRSSSWRGRFRSRIPNPSGSHLRSSEPRAGGSGTTSGFEGSATTLKGIVLTESSKRFGAPLGMLNPTALRAVARLREITAGGVVADIEDFGLAGIDDEAEQTPTATEPTEPEDVRPSDGAAKGQGI